VACPFPSQAWEAVVLGLVSVHRTCSTERSIDLRGGGGGIVTFCIAVQSGVFTLFCCCVGEGAQTLLPDRVRWACEEWSVILNRWFEHPKAPYVSCGCGGCGGACGVSCGVVNQQLHRAQHICTIRPSKLHTSFLISNFPLASKPIPRIPRSVLPVYHDSTSKVVPSMSHFSS